MRVLVLTVDISFGDDLAVIVSYLADGFSVVVGHLGNHVFVVDGCLPDVILVLVRVLLGAVLEVRRVVFGVDAHSAVQVHIAHLFDFGEIQEQKASNYECPS